MKTLSRFISKFTHLIVAVLSCFDRVIFKGRPLWPWRLLANSNTSSIVVLKVRRTDFP